MVTKFERQTARAERAGSQLKYVNLKYDAVICILVIGYILRDLVQAQIRVKGYFGPPVLKVGINAETTSDVSRYV